MRDYKKLREEYKDLKAKKAANFGKFYADDVIKVIETGKKPGGSYSDFEAITTALEAGFMLGYKAGKRDAKKEG